MQENGQVQIPLPKTNTLITDEDASWGFFCLDPEVYPTDDALLPGGGAIVGYHQDPRILQGKWCGGRIVRHNISPVLFVLHCDKCGWRIEVPTVVVKTFSDLRDLITETSSSKNDR